MMEFVANEMEAGDRARLKALVNGRDFEVLLTAIEGRECELRYELARLSIEKQALGAVEPEGKTTDVQALTVNALRWKAAREVLAEVASQKFSPIAGGRITIGP